MLQVAHPESAGTQRSRKRPSTSRGSWQGKQLPQRSYLPNWVGREGLLYETDDLPPTGVKSRCDAHLSELPKSHLAASLSTGLKADFQSNPRYHLASLRGTAHKRALLKQKTPLQLVNREIRGFKFLQGWIKEQVVWDQSLPLKVWRTIKKIRPYLTMVFHLREYRFKLLTEFFLNLKLIWKKERWIGFLLGICLTWTNVIGMTYFLKCFYIQMIGEEEEEEGEGETEESCWVCTLPCLQQGHKLSA